ncbi:MAG: sterol desaturase family protein [Gammaproteobacteria bacterium]|nr:sterol desaturase family protein [Gammaproteobacteria bacterium]
MHELIDTPSQLRLTIFLAMLLIMAVWEILAPRRLLTQNKASRWINNLALITLNSIILRILFPTATIGFAMYAAEHEFGLLHKLALPEWLSIVITLVFLDLVIYFQHVIFHKVPLLWRLHRVHHTDLDFDITTGLRFHPLEMILSMLVKFLAILLLGAPSIAVVIFEIVLNSAAIFNHGNIYIPKAIDRMLRLLLVTPDMHRIHHSCRQPETDSNYGFSISLWDRLFGNYRDQPEAGHNKMMIGLQNPRKPELCIPIQALLKTPFISQ